jgi:hypothetical protein
MGEIGLLLGFVVGCIVQSELEDPLQLADFRHPKSLNMPVETPGCVEKVSGRAFFHIMRWTDDHPVAPFLTASVRAERKC